MSEKIKIEAGKFYADRKGRVYGPLGGDCYPITGRHSIWSEDGKYKDRKEQEHEFDLIREVFVYDTPKKKKKKWKPKVGEDVLIPAKVLEFTGTIGVKVSLPVTPNSFFTVADLRKRKAKKSLLDPGLTKVSLSYLKGE